MILKKFEGGRGKEERLLPRNGSAKEYQLVECRGTMPSQNSWMPSEFNLDPQSVQPSLPEKLTNNPAQNLMRSGQKYMKKERDYMQIKLFKHV